MAMDNGMDYGSIAIQQPIILEIKYYKTLMKIYEGL